MLARAWDVLPPAGLEHIPPVPVHLVSRALAKSSEFVMNPVGFLIGSPLSGPLWI